MRRAVLALLLAAVAACTAPTVRPEPAQTPEDLLLAAERQHTPWPLLSARPGGLSPQQAWRLQRLLVTERLRRSPLAGFKTGLVRPAAQARFGLDEPLFGVLTADGEYPVGATVQAATFRRLMIETELAMIVGDRVLTPPASREEAAAHITAVALAFELPDLGYEPGTLRGVDILATNAGAAAWVLGATVTTGGLPDSPDTIDVELSHDGQTIAVGNVGEQIGDVWDVARWLMTRALELGYDIAPGAVLLTGAVIGPLPVREGRWVAQAGRLGRVQIDIETGDVTSR